MRLVTCSRLRFKQWKAGLHAFIQMVDFLDLLKSAAKLYYFNFVVAFELSKTSIESTQEI